MIDSPSGRSILVLNYEFPPLGGGASPISYAITKGYVDAGYHVDVVTMGYAGLPSFERKDGINIHRVKSGRKKKELSTFPEQLRYLIAAFFAIQALLKKNTYSHCHCHFLVPTGILAYIFSRRSKLPYIVTSHGSDVPGHNPDRFTLLHRFTAPVIKAIIRRSRFVTVPSGSLKKLIEKNILSGRSNDKIVVIPNGSHSLSKPGLEKENIILSVGRMQPMKGFQYLIPAFISAGRNDWKLYLVGDGPYRKTLESLAANHENIIFTGWLDNSDDRLIDLYNRAKIFALLSQTESQGIVLVEAMSAGCAILASNQAAIQETVSADTGIHVNPENFSEVVQKLSQLMTDQNLRDTFSQAARRRFLERYTWDTIIKRYLRLIEAR
ncbi:MAG: glycosyltransferase family 4 protein [Patescibacteria group bacterium]